MKKKMIICVAVLCIFAAIISAIFIKKNENQQAVDEIIRNTIRDDLENDDGMGMDEISNTFSKETLEKVGYENLSDIAYVKVDGEVIHLVYFSDEVEEALYLAAKLMLEIDEEYVLQITWKDKEYEISEEKADGSVEKFYKLFPEEWYESIDNAMSGNGIQYLVTKGIADEIDEDVEKFTEKWREEQEKSENQSIEETKSENSSIELVDKLEWKYDENNYFTVWIYRDVETQKLGISMFGDYEEQNIGLMQNDFILVWAYAYAGGIDANVTCDIGEESYVLLMADGKVLMNTIPTDEMEETPQNYNELVKEMIAELDKFYVNNGIKEEKIEEIVYQDENIIITYTGITGTENKYNINFIIENLSDKTLTVQVRESSINGFMVDPLCSIEIAPGKKAIDKMIIWSEDAENHPMSSVENIETKFLIYNENDRSDRYETENVIIVGE